VQQTTTMRMANAARRMTGSSQREDAFCSDCTTGAAMVAMCSGETGEMQNGDGILAF
jgi:hypothetical protein